MHSTNTDFFHQLQLKQPHSNINERANSRFSILIPFQKHQAELVRELGFFSIKIYYQSDKILITEHLKNKPMYAQDWWPDTQFRPLTEYPQLKTLANWGSYYHCDNFKYEKSIRAAIKNLDCKRIEWKINHPFNFKFFTWTVVNDFIFYCEKPFQRFPLGWHEFIEDKNSPPNRAYVKLWEILMVQDFFDTADMEESTCIEVGCSPGGWTWVLAQLFKSVHAVDKAPLDKKLSRFKNIIYKSDDAFKLNPADFKDTTWFFSDIICTPQRMKSLMDSWLDLSKVQHFVSTIKFKGEVDFHFLQEFQREKSKQGTSQILHLYHNKNEVTWLFKKNLA